MYPRLKRWPFTSTSVTPLHPHSKTTMKKWKRSPHKTLSAQSDDKLTFQLSTELFFFECQQHLLFLRKLQVHQSILNAFYKCFIESIPTFNVAAWFGLRTLTHRNALNKIIRTSSNIIGQEQRSLTTIYSARVMKKSPYTSGVNSPGQQFVWF